MLIDVIEKGNVFPKLCVDMKTEEDEEGGVERERRLPWARRALFPFQKGLMCKCLM